MAEVVNLNKARKLRVKAKKESKAEENRIRFGLSKAQKMKNTSERAGASKKLDRLRLTRRDTDNNQ